jgi:hypothetical protein
MNADSDDQAGPLTERAEAISAGEVLTQVSSTGPARGSLRSQGGSANGSGPSVELHIDELLLDGFEPAHRYAIGDAVERELMRLFSEQNSLIAATEDVEIAHLNSGAINLELASSAEATGIQLARAIYRGLLK